MITIDVVSWDLLFMQIVRYFTFPYRVYRPSCVLFSATGCEVVYTVFICLKDNCLEKEKENTLFLFKFMECKFFLFLRLYLQEKHIKKEN